MKPTLEELVPHQESAHQLAIVTQNCVIIRDPERQSYSIVGLPHVSGIKRIITTHPVLLVIAAALFVISAAAFCSNESSGAYLTIFLLGMAAVVGYWLTRTGAVALVAGSQRVVTGTGSVSEARSLIADVQSALSDRLS